MNKIFLLLFLFTTFLSSAQTGSSSIFSALQSSDSIGSNVVINQDPSIRLLIDRDVSINGRIHGMLDGYRIQIFSGYGNDARDKSKVARVNFLSTFPDFDPVRVYSKYDPPFIKVRVGDYRNRHEALKDYRNIVREFNDCYIVKSRINYPKIQ